MAFLGYKLFLNTWVVELGFIDGPLFSLMGSMGSALDSYGMLARVKSRLDLKLISCSTLLLSHLFLATSFLVLSVIVLTVL